MASVTSKETVEWVITVTNKKGNIGSKLYALILKYVCLKYTSYSDSKKLVTAVPNVTCKPRQTDKKLTNSSFHTLYSLCRLGI